jgi:hypothetical protein
MFSFGRRTLLFSAKLGVHTSRPCFLVASHIPTLSKVFNRSMTSDPHSKPSSVPVRDRDRSAASGPAMGPQANRPNHLLHSLPSSFSPFPSPTIQSASEHRHYLAQILQEALTIAEESLVDMDEDSTMELEDRELSTEYASTSVPRGRRLAQ